VAIRGNEWVAGIAQGLNVVKVSVADVRVEHEVKLTDFTKWLDMRDGASEPGQVRRRTRLFRVEIKADENGSPTWNEKAYPTKLLAFEYSRGSGASVARTAPRSFCIASSSCRQPTMARSVRQGRQRDGACNELRVQKKLEARVERYP
jgi:hypothetical protein